MKKIKNLYIVILLLLVACSTNSSKISKEKSDQKIERNKKVSVGLPILDLSKDYPKKKITLQDIADVEYIALETNEDALLKSTSIYITSNKIIASDLLGTIVIFDRRGKYLHSFNHKGQSGEEYRDPISIAVDNEEIFVVDFWKKCIQVYDYEGKYRRTLRLPAKSNFSSSIFNYNDDFLLGNDKYMVDTGKDDQTNKTPYCKISKKTGKLTPLPLKFTKRIGDEFVQYIDEQNSIGGILGVSPLATFGSDGLIADFTLDTAYIYQNDVLQPIAVRKNCVSNNNKPIISTIEFLTDRYQLWFTQEKNLDFKTKNVPEPVFYLIDKKINECYLIEFFNADGVTWADVTTSIYERLSANIHSVPPKYAIQIYKPEKLIKFNNEGKLKGELKIIASKLKEDDNPVLMIAKFKE